MGKYTAQISSQQSELRIEGNFTDHNYLSITSLHTDSLNLDISSGSGRNNERANIFHKKFTFCGDVNHSSEKN